MKSYNEYTIEDMLESLARTIRHHTGIPVRVYMDTDRVRTFYKLKPLTKKEIKRRKFI